jgi:hypothetical protein
LICLKDLAAKIALEDGRDPDAREGELTRSGSEAALAERANAPIRAAFCMPKRVQGWTPPRGLVQAARDAGRPSRVS